MVTTLPTVVLVKLQFPKNYVSERLTGTCEMFPLNCIPLLNTCQVDVDLVHIVCLVCRYFLTINLFVLYYYHFSFSLE